MLKPALVLGGVTALLLTLLGATTLSSYSWDLPPGFPPPLVPEDNPMTEAKVELGRHLFYDTRLSGNGAQACASCHKQDLAFSDGLGVSVGSTGERHPRNSQSLTNVAYNATLTWGNPVLEELEQQILVPMFGEFPVELGMTGKEEAIYAELAADPLYERLFAEAFPNAAVTTSAVTTKHIVDALASFTRTLISGESRYDAYVYGGQRDALTLSEKRGMDLFLSEKTECHHCHGGFNFSHSVKHQNNAQFVEKSFHNTGLYNLDEAGAYPLGNGGVFEITGKPGDMGKFRAPSLRNVELSAPYFHDGSAETLGEVLSFYEAGGRLTESGEHTGDGRRNPHKSGFVRGFSLSDRERTDLIAFLKSLTDETFITNPAFSNPFTD